MLYSRQQNKSETTEASGRTGENGDAQGLHGDHRKAIKLVGGVVTSKRLLLYCDAQGRAMWQAGAGLFQKKSDLMDITYYYWYDASDGWGPRYLRSAPVSDYPGSGPSGLNGPCVEPSYSLQRDACDELRLYYGAINTDSGYINVGGIAHDIIDDVQVAMYDAEQAKKAASSAASLQYYPAYPGLPTLLGYGLMGPGYKDVNNRYPEYPGWDMPYRGKSLILPCDAETAQGGGTDAFNELFNRETGVEAVTMVDGGGHTCYGLFAGYTVTLPNTVTAVAAAAFDGQAALRGITGQTVTSVGDYAFQNCNTLGSVNLPNVLTIGHYAFSQCSGLMSFTANSIGTNGLSDGAFYYSGLTSARFGNSLNAIPGSCFEGCSRLIDLWLGGPPPSIGGSALETSGPPLTVHVRSSRLADYQADQGWQDEIQRLADEFSLTVTIVGDYE